MLGAMGGAMCDIPWVWRGREVESRSGLWRIVKFR